MRMRHVLGSLACGAVLLAGAAGCSSDEPEKKPTAKEVTGSEAPAPAPADANTLLTQGLQQGQAGKLDDAKASFEQVVALDAKNKYGWFNLGYIAQSRNQFDEALTNYDKALQIDDSYRPALYNKAMVLENSDGKAAIDLYREIISMDAKASTAHLRLGLLLVKDGDEKAAKAEFKEAVKLNSALRESVPADYRAALSAKGGR